MKAVAGAQTCRLLSVGCTRFYEVNRRTVFLQSERASACRFHEQ